MTENLNVSGLEDIFDPGVSRTRKTEVVKNVFNEKNYLNTRLNNGETTREIKIRILLTKDNDGRNKMAIPVLFHNMKLTDKQQQSKVISKTSKFKSFVCLNDTHIQNEDGCPLCKKMSEIFKEANSYKEGGEHPNSEIYKSLCKEAYKYEPKTVYLVRCIERGKEEEGVKFWRFNKHDDGNGIYDTLYYLYNQCKEEDGVNMFDYNEGFDIVIRLTGTSDKTTTSVSLSRKPSKLADTQEQIDAWVNDGKNWQDMYRSKSYEYLNIVAEGESPIWSNEENKFVKWVPVEELKQREKDIEAEAIQELKTSVSEPVDIVEDNNELPF